MIINTPEGDIRGDTEGTVKKKTANLTVSEDSPYRLKDGIKYINLDTRSASVTIPAKPDVEYGSFTPVMKNFLADVALDLGSQEDLPFDFVITSGIEGEHSKNSLHYTGQAVDIRIAPIFRGNIKGEDTPWDDPVYKYFYEGKGKDLLSKHKMSMLSKLEHGDAPHIHIEEGMGKFKNSDQTSNKTSITPPVLSNTYSNVEDRYIIPTFLADVSNEKTKVEKQMTEVEESPSLQKLLGRQMQREQIKQSIIDYQNNAFVTPKVQEQTAPSGSYTPNPIIQTQFQTLEQATGLPQFANGGETDPPNIYEDITKGTGKYKSSIIFDDGSNLYYRPNNVDTNLFSKFSVDEKTGMYVVPKYQEKPSNTDILKTAITSDLPEGYRKTYDPSRSGDPFDYYHTDSAGIEKRITNQQFIDATNDPEAILKEKL